MDIHSYLMFVGASVMLCVVPGPDMILLLTRSIAQGRRAGLMTALGINAGGYFHLAAAVVGISAIITSSAIAFTLLKCIGAVYLLYLGVAALRTPADLLKPDAADQTLRTWRVCFWQGFWSDVLNPKVALFFMALLPQFVVPDARVTGQLIVLGVTSNFIAIVFNVAIVFFAASIGARLRRDPRVSTWLGKLLGGVFIALGLRLAGEKVV